MVCGRAVGIGTRERERGREKEREGEKEKVVEALKEHHNSNMRPECLISFL